MSKTTWFAYLESSKQISRLVTAITTVDRLASKLFNPISAGDQQNSLDWDETTFLLFLETSWGWSLTHVLMGHAWLTVLCVCCYIYEDENMKHNAWPYMEIEVFSQHRRFNFSLVSLEYSAGASHSSMLSFHICCIYQKRAQDLQDVRFGSWCWCTGNTNEHHQAKHLSHFHHRYQCLHPMKKFLRENDIII